MYMKKKVTAGSGYLKGFQGKKVGRKVEGVNVGLDRKKTSTKISGEKKCWKVRPLTNEMKAGDCFPRGSFPRRNTFHTSIISFCLF